MTDNRKRIRVACDTCRRKKIKCDGNLPCSNCKATNEHVCHYAERQSMKHRRFPARDPKQLLSARIGRLEDIILDLSEKLGGLAEVRQRVMSESRGYSFLSDSEDDSEETRDHAKEGLSSDGTRYSNEEEGNVVADKFPPKKVELFYGAHTFANLVSRGSISWMQKQLGEKEGEMVLPLTNMPILFSVQARLFFAKWLDPPAMTQDQKRRILTRPFPENPTLIFGIIDMFMTPILRMEGVGDTKRVRAMFERYYKSKDRFTIAELLIMTVSLAFLIFMRFETNVGPLEQVNDGSEWSDQALQQLENNLMSNAIYYYHLLCVIGGGIDTIEAILLFTGYLECHWFSPLVNYMVLFPAIRYAQDMGLHRIESYFSLDEATAAHRKRIWWTCCYMDMEICFRNGKSPIINRWDVSPELLDIEIGEIDISDTQQVRDLYKFFSHVQLLRARSYERLFSASADIGTFASLLANLDMLNEQIFASASHLPDNLRPYFYNNPKFQISTHKSKVENEISWCVRLTYFYHIMLINRLPMILNIETDDIDKMEYYRNLSLDSARTMLHILKSSEGSNLSNSFFAWVLFFPSSAFLHLLTACMNYPNSPQAYSDLMLLIDTSMDFVTRRGVDGNLESMKKFHRFSLTLVTFRLLLRIVIAIFEKQTKISILEHNVALKQHLDAAKDVFPELFQSPEAFKLTVDAVKLDILSQSPFVEDSAQRSAASFHPSRRLHPDDVPLPSPEGQTAFLGGFPNNGQFAHEDIDSLIRAQMKELPNIFFDNPQFP